MIIERVQAHLIYQYSRVNLVAVTYVVRSAKNHQDRGYKFHYNVCDVLDTAAFNIVVDMYEWAKLARPSGTDMFLSCRLPGMAVVLNREMYTKAIKTVAAHMGMDPAKYSTHSGRYAGAAMLAAAGLPDHIIQQMGRWKSDVFMKYIRFSLRSMNAAMNAIVSASNCTVDMIKKMYIGA